MCLTSVPGARSGRWKWGEKPIPKRVMVRAPRVTKAAKMNTKKGSVSAMAGFSRENGSSSIVTNRRRR